MDEPQMEPRADPPPAHCTRPHCHARLLAELHSALKCSGYCELRRVHCTWEGDSIIISGCVPSYYMKQVAQCIVQRRAPAVPVDNRVRVAPQGTGTQD
jgi:hypothetical protein